MNANRCQLAGPVHQTACSLNARAATHVDHAVCLRAPLLCVAAALAVTAKVPCRLPTWVLALVQIEPVARAVSRPGPHRLRCCQALPSTWLCGAF